MFPQASAVPKLPKSRPSRKASNKAAALVTQSPALPFRPACFPAAVREPEAYHPAGRFNIKAGRDRSPVPAVGAVIVRVIIILTSAFTEARYFAASSMTSAFPVVIIGLLAGIFPVFVEAFPKASEAVHRRSAEPASPRLRIPPNMRGRNIPVIEVFVSDGSSASLQMPRAGNVVRFGLQRQGRHRSGYPVGKAFRTNR